MHAKQKHLEGLTKNHMVGSQHKLEQLWSNYHGQRFSSSVTFYMTQRDLMEWNVITLFPV